MSRNIIRLLRIYLLMKTPTILIKKTLKFVIMLITPNMEFFFHCTTSSSFTFTLKALLDTKVDSPGAVYYSSLMSSDAGITFSYVSSSVTIHHCPTTP